VKDTLCHHDQCCVWWRGEWLWCGGCWGAGWCGWDAKYQGCVMKIQSFFAEPASKPKQETKMIPCFFFPLCPLCFFFTLISVRTTHIIRPKAWLWGIFSYQCRLKRSSLFFVPFFFPTPLFFYGDIDQESASVFLSSELKGTLCFTYKTSKIIKPPYNSEIYGAAEPVFKIWKQLIYFILTNNVGIEWC